MSGHFSEWRAGAPRLQLPRPVSANLRLFSLNEQSRVGPVASARQSAKGHADFGLRFTQSTYFFLFRFWRRRAGDPGGTS